MKEIRLRDIVETRKRAISIVENSDSVGCREFVKHVSVACIGSLREKLTRRQFAMCHDEWLIKENIVQLRQLMSDQNLQLLPDYEQRVQVLKDLDFIDESSRVQLKGKVACEVRGRELPLFELELMGLDSFSR